VREAWKIYLSQHNLVWEHYMEGRGGEENLPELFPIASMFLGWEWER